MQCIEAQCIAERMHAWLACVCNFLKTAAHLLMVAGDAYCRSATSNNSFTCGARRMRSPLGSVSSLLSSITLFMFSTQTWVPGGGEAEGRSMRGEWDGQFVHWCSQQTTCPEAAPRKVVLLCCRLLQKLAQHPKRTHKAVH